VPGQRSDISCKLANFRRGGMCRIQILDILCKLANFRRGGICARFKDQTYHASLLISGEVVFAGFKDHIMQAC
jgi:hypothetical protein